MNSHVFMGYMKNCENLRICINDDLDCTAEINIDFFVFISKALYQS